MEEAGDLGNGLIGEGLPEPVVPCSICSLNLCLKKTNTGKWMVGCQGSPNCTAAPLWFPSSVKEASVTATTCNTCNLGPHFVHLILSRGALAPHYPDSLSTCLGGCQTFLLEMLGVQRLNSGAVARPRQDGRGRDARGALRGGRADRRGGRGGPRGGGGYGRGDPRGGGGGRGDPRGGRGGRGDPRGGGGAAMAVGRASARPGTGRGRGVGRGRGRGTGSQDLEYDCSLSTQAQGTSHAFEAKRQQLRDLNGGAAPVQELACSCGTPAASRTVRKEGPNKGRDFFCCSKPQGEQCGFFKFADEVVAGGSQTGGGARAAFGGGGGDEAGRYAEGAVDPPVCQCGQVKVMRTVRKEGPTQGKQFFVCPKDRDQQCPNNFQWSDDVAPTLQGGAGGVGFGGGIGFVGRGQARGGEKRMREAFGGAAGQQAQKKQRKCGLCHQPGHTRNR